MRYLLMVQLDDLIDRFEYQSEMIQQTREKMKKKEVNKMYDPKVNGERNSVINDPKYTKVDEEKLMKTNRIDANNDDGMSTSLQTDESMGITYKYHKRPLGNDNFYWEGEINDLVYRPKVSPLGPLECKVCGNRFTPLKENKYIVKKYGMLTKMVDYYDAFDCPFCGCQIVANIRYLGK